MSQPTIFSKIIQREIPADIIYEDDLCLAFHDINPQAPIHILLIPKIPVEQLSHCTDPQLMGHLLTQANHIAQKFDISDAFRLVINNGAGAGQTVFHLHIHILAGRPFQWPPG